MKLTSPGEARTRLVPMADVEDPLEKMTPSELLEEARQLRAAVDIYREVLSRYRAPNVRQSIFRGRCVRTA